MEFHIEKSRFRAKPRFKESKSDDGCHPLNRDFTVPYFRQYFQPHTVLCEGEEETALLT